MVKRFALFLALPAVALSLPAFASRVHSASTHATAHVSARAHAVSGRAFAGGSVSPRSAGVHTVSFRTVRGRRTAVHTVLAHHEPVASMDSGRATEIQSALIRAGYLSGEPTGVWDSQSVAAMQKLQDDNGWQTKYTPDSRALVKLGLGSAPLPPTPPTGTAALEAQSNPTAQP